MPPSNYEIFLDVVKNCFLGCTFTFKRNIVTLRPTILSPYDIIRDIDVPKTPYEKYIKNLPEDFIYNARTELYRKNRGWIDRGVQEHKIIKYIEEGKINLVPILRHELTVGIDSSRNLFVVCCFDNYLTGINYVERYLDIKKDIRKNEYKWHKINDADKKYLITKINTLLNISCKALFAINSNFINSSNRLTRNQFIGIIQGCFTGYENDPTQNFIYRDNLRKYFFNLCNSIPIHCDPDFGNINPEDIVRLVVRNLSRIDGRIQPCTPSYVTLRSHESLSIQLADLIAGIFSTQIQSGEVPPNPTKHLLFNEKWISRKDIKKGKWAKAYYWKREVG
jgi:hypothetical protein